MSKVRQLKSAAITDEDLQGVKVVDTGKKNQHQFQLPTHEGGLDISHCKLDPAKGEMEATLSRTASDSAFIAFCKLYQEFSPLLLEPACKDPDIAIKLLQAAKLTGVEIQLLPEDEHLARTSKAHGNLYRSNH